MKLHLDKCIYFLIFSNPIISLIFDGTKVRYFYFTLPFLYILLIVRIAKAKKYTKKILLINSISLISIVSGFFRGGDFGKINNHLFNYLVAMMLMFYIAIPKYREMFFSFTREKVNILVMICCLINIVELFMLVTRRGYILKRFWGGYYFQGTNSMPHTLSYLMVVVIIIDICIMIVKRDKRYLLFSIIPSYCILVSGVRIALIPLGILSLIIIDTVFSSRNKSIPIRIFKAIIVIGLLIVIFWDRIISSSMTSKIISRIDENSISSGRFDIWAYLLQIFSGDFMNFLVGMGDQTVYYYTSIHPVYHREIWAHSDFIQILVGKGLPCLLCYLYSLKTWIGTSLIRNKNYYSILFYFVIILLAAFNGFYNYRDLMLMIPMMSFMIYLLQNEWFVFS